MKIEIDVDLGPYAKEWEPVAFRRPLKGEWFITDVGHPHVWSFQEHTNPRLIIRRKWKWPEWLKAEWIAMDLNGSWFAYLVEPRAGVAAWATQGHTQLPLASFKKFFDFEPPAVAGWKESLIRNPNLPEKE